MRKLTSAVLATAAAMLFVARLDAQQLQYSSGLSGGGGYASGGAPSCCDTGPSCCSPCCGCDQSGFLFQHEITMFRYHKNDGIPVSDEFDFEPASRVTLGYRGPDGLGLRARYWKYDHTNPDNVVDPSSVDTYTIDVEFFEEIDLGCCSSIEFSAGFRYNDFLEENFVSALNGVAQGRQQYSAIGGIIGIQANRNVSALGSVYARLRQAVLMSDWNNAGTELPDTVQGMTEISLGARYTLLCNNCYSVSAIAGVEWQQWQNYDAANSRGTGAMLDDVSDVGFGGFVFGISGDY